MVKTKKGKKEVVSGDDEMVNNETTAIDDQDDAGSSDNDTVTAKNKKNKKKDNNKKKAGKPAKSAASDDESVDDDDDDEVSAITQSVKKLQVGKKGKAKNVPAPDSDDDGSEDEKPTKQKKKNNKKAKKSSAFDLLMAEDDDEPCKPATESEDEPEPVEVVEVKPKKNEKKKGKKSKRKDDDDDEDLDKVLAELQKEYAGEKPAEPVVATADDIADEDSKKKNKKGAKAQAPAENADGDDDDESTVKTAAQKKKEKKERQKKEAALAKLKEKEGKSKPAAAVDPEPAEVKETPVEPEPAADPEKEESPAAEDDGEKTSKDDKKKKGKKDKKEKKVEEEKKDDKKSKSGMSKSVVAAMQERLKKIKEEEERLAKEEEERIRLEEERENQRLEAIRLEQEKKEKKKQKEAERKARLKAEGKLLTKKQKEDRARAQAMLDALKAQGLEIPDPTEKRPRPGTRYRPSKKKGPAQKQEEEKTEDGQSQNESSKDNTPQPEDEKNLEETVKESWDASASEEEDDDSQEKSSEATQQEKDAADNAAKEKDDEETDSADEDSSDDDSEGDDDDDDDSDDDDKRAYDPNDPKMKRERALARREKLSEEAQKRRTTDDLRAAVVCVLGHVDTGKTKILDKLRRTHVQDSEAGGITQQIGATNVPIDAIKEQAKVVKGGSDFEHKLPGLLIIDTPGHESFSNLRNRGSSLCDISILVVDIMHGLEPQTIESISLLKKKKCPFIVALNKIDRLYDWQVMPRKDIRDVIKGQQANTQVEFQQRTKEVILQFAEQGLNAALFYENPDPRTYVSLVPTSAITGEGMGNLLFLIVEFCQNMLAKRLMYSDELQATVLEVKAIPGLGTTIDAILINGKLREGQTMILAGTDGPITTQIRSLLMPQPLKELRVKNAYVEYKEIKAAQGVKIAAKDLEKAIAGINLLIANKPDEVEICREEVAKELKNALSHIKLSTPGVFVQASTLGSLEALLEFLRTSKIPYFAIRIGPVVKRDVMKASTMLEHEAQYATILAFDVKVERDAQEMADSLGVKIFQADIIYHLFDKFMAYREELKQKKREEFRSVAVFPCKLKILPQFIFNSRDPIVMGVMVENGIVKEGTPICVPSKEFVDIGVVTSIECNHKQIETARKGQEICIKIEPIPGESPKMFGRHFDADDMLVSKVTRQSIDACKNYFRDDLIKADWALMVELKKTFEIL
ncbi:eukaryotic translation initiation factor 5B [Episyrphus balteatus]|uniref:eukaryotic translation initiation factor 5B n=1 Tax=Episyrphus balteatus TaxID=286459 RepID=UPI0024867743|nr:eukaryotic translation initiation factor 5B [Episyrphus balteatus]